LLKVFLIKPLNLATYFNTKDLEQYIAFLRGINVGGNKKVPMSELKDELPKNGYKNIITILNSGNVIFETPAKSNDVLENEITEILFKKFGFNIPIIVRNRTEIINLMDKNIFSEYPETLHRYFTFLKEPLISNTAISWTNTDDSFQVIKIETDVVYSILDVSKIQSTKGMEMLEKVFGKNITTRNLNTLEKIIAKLN